MQPLVILNLNRDIIENTMIINYKKFKLKVVRSIEKSDFCLRLLSHVRLRDIMQGQQGLFNIYTMALAAGRASNPPPPPNF